MNSFLKITMLIFLFSAGAVYANSGGNGFPGGPADGQPGMPGCGGGTDPSPDGKFYTPEGIQCNPGTEDAKKTPSHPEQKKA
ncbi:hypothetical protein CC684_20120 [Salmonella enterica subsp. enterica serovar Bareilly]|uniref:Periplasmic protein n=4 Tax=Salmonella enterica TaxID=28901 RepID=A0A5Y3UDD3_SALTM|nr:hypothetical protein [Salmonella enterica]EBF6680411.1 hypothetical protein [Salmonella enterica subsp. enterica serovar Typhimurium]EBG0179821.1 hypothetical protein [Salmonella enterica subsp. enterica serovar Bareilly]EBI0515834.1 hypothetical protein [Salmonella enterica subsp. enterica serovar Brunei]EBM0637400.1 hypothetical protein [Salmonella enterica subsp. enterica serovar Enteritidis]EBP4394791.1 hypothetical protein [Salmonella enterica subsp. enterica]ECD7125516.1 hypothetical